MKYNSIIVVTYGRSGSTLLQGVLNSIEGCLIRGENKMFCRGLYETYKSLMFARSHYGMKSNAAWYGAEQLDIDYFLTSCNKMVEKLLTGDSGKDEITCFGFKEVRYLEIITEFEDYLGFLLKIFPNLAFVFNTRNHDEVVNSGWWKEKDASSVKTDLAQLDSVFHDYVKNNDNAFMVDYRDVVNKTRNLKLLFNFLGAPFQKPEIDRVLMKPHSYDQSQPSVLKLKRESVALCLTIRNEEVLLRNNLLYHKNIGVGKVYLYLDNTTDSSKKSVSDLDFVEVQKSAALDSVRDTRGWGIRGGRVALFYDNTHVARQQVNMLDAYKKAGADGYDWLLCIDADELVYLNGKTLSSDVLCEVLASYPHQTDMVNFLPIECVQNKLAYDNVVFEEQVLFKSSFNPAGDLNPQIHRFRKEIVLPLSGCKMFLPPYYGHAIGKVAVRTRSGFLPHTHHEFYHPKRKTNLAKSAYLVHYTLYSADDFIKKHLNFQGHPSVWLKGGDVNEELLEWIEFVNCKNKTREEITSYYQDNLMYSDTFLKDLKSMRSSPLMEINDLPEYVKKSAQLPLSH